MGTPVVESIRKYMRYSGAYLKYGDFESILDSFRFMLLKKGAMRNRVLKSDLGKVKIRKGTNDFQFANFYYEWGVKSYLLQVFKEYDAFFDVGAGIGDYSLLMAQRGLKSYAFEPIAENYKIVEENIALNNLSDLIIPFHLALGAKKEECEFVMKAINTGASHKVGLNVNPTIDDLSVEKVQVETLDNLFPHMKLNKNDALLIKMDLEGMETEALKGAKEFIRYFNKITLILESKHSWDKKLIETLFSVANFDIGQVDELNIYAKKLTNL